MANPEHVEIVEWGAEAIRRWRNENPDTELNLCGANLCGVNLRDADLNEANLDRVDLSESDLSAANLTGSSFDGANLNRVNLHDARMVSTMLTDIDLQKVSGLENLLHLGPSRISTDTLTRSQGQIPPDFLQGCGLSLWEVEMAKLYDPDLTTNDISNIVTEGVFAARADGPIYIGGVFISYSHADAGLSDKLYQHLQEAGTSVWQDRHDMLAGDMNRQVLRELRRRDVVILILSEASVNSDWVEHELKEARKKEKEEGRDVLCPIAVDDTWKAKLDDPK